MPHKPFERTNEYVQTHAWQSMGIVVGVIAGCVAVPIWLFATFESKNAAALRALYFKSTVQQVRYESIDDKQQDLLNKKAAGELTTAEETSLQQYAAKKAKAEEKLRDLDHAINEVTAGAK